MLFALISFCSFLKKSKFGYYLNAIRNDQEAAMSLGINLTFHKVLATMASAFLTGLGGTFYAQLVLFISPEKVFSPALSFQIAIMAIVGGRSHIAGPLFGTLILTPASEITKIALGGKIMGADLALYSLILMIIIRYRPQGISDLFIKVYSNVDIAIRWLLPGKRGLYGSS